MNAPLINPPFIASAIRGGAMLTAQYSDITGFMLHISWPMVAGIPNLQSCNSDLGEAFVELEAAVIEHMKHEEELFET